MSFLSISGKRTWREKKKLLTSPKIFCMSCILYQSAGLGFWTPLPLFVSLLFVAYCRWGPVTCILPTVHKWESSRLKPGLPNPHTYSFPIVAVQSLSRVQLLATPWTAAYQAPLPMGFSKQECWSGVPLPSPTNPLPISNYFKCKSIKFSNQKAERLNGF